MVTEANARLNLKTAARNVRGRLGLPESPLSWTIEQRGEFNRELAVEILKYPNSFTPEIIGMAADIQNNVYDLVDGSFSWGGFGGDIFGKALTVTQIAAYVSIIGGLILIAKELGLTAKLRAALK